MLNVIAIMGRLVADPIMRQTQTGRAVASIRIASDRGRIDANGNMQVDFFDVICWESRADFVCKWFKKGSLIAIEGRLQSRNYTDKYNNNRTAIEIVAGNINFVGSKQQDTPAATAPSNSNYTSHADYAAGPADDFAVIDDNDDLPF